VKRLAVLGDPVAHSRSPAMQNAALAALGLGDEWSYEAIRMPPADFPELTRALPDEGFVGANVTIPHKEAALALAGDASAAATEIGAANTLSFDDAREIRADNTDAPGLLAALGRPPSGMRALVFGAGGSARAAAWALASQGAAVDVWNRTRERATELVSSLAGTAADAGALSTVGEDAARGGGHDLIVNCTAIGLDAADDPFTALPIDRDRLGDSIVLDLVYGSGADTQLIHAARAAGSEVINGLEVLVRQGAESLRIWTGREPDLEVMRLAARGS
jgi:shikimate dehydrogenase